MGDVARAACGEEQGDCSLVQGAEVRERAFWKTSIRATTKLTPFPLNSFGAFFSRRSLQLLGQNVTLTRDVAEHRAKQDFVSDAYLQNMQRYLVAAKQNIDAISEKIEVNNRKDLDQPPPLSFEAVAEFIKTHNTDYKLIGHVLCALNKRMTESPDVEIRRHAAHDAAIEDVMTLYIDEWEDNSVFMQLLCSNTNGEESSGGGDETGFLRSNYYAAKLVNNLSR